MKKLNQSTVILIALVLGAVFGIILPNISLSFSFIGDIFLKLVQMSLPLLILGQVIAAVGNINIRELGKLGGRTIGLFLVMSLFGAIWGALVAGVFNPGVGLDMSNQASTAVQETDQSLVSVITGFFPSNIFAALSEASLMQITVFALFFGIALSLLQDEKGETLTFTKVLDNVNDIVMKIMSIVMRFAPIGVFSLTSSALATYGIDVIISMIYYVFVFYLAMISYLLIWHVIEAIYLKESVWTVIKQTLNMSLFAFSVNSSAVAFPTQLRDSKSKLGVSEDISSFVNPLGMNLNSPGSALSNAFVLIMAGQMYGMNFSLADYVMVVFIGFAASYATAVIPGGGIVSLNIVLPAMGFGPEAIAIFAAVDYPTGMMRSLGNVNLDATAAVIVGESLNEVDHDILNDRKEYIE